ncbi:syntaxin of plants 31 [Actinidia rufa]|uniref:Syntaxin of plants 31 n=1 Tax=Actinidia rufa TaxID=165716 RepID=A0A7J0DBS3_9ERIC|nr:syntaxin of plants 31 [Actinidia rufa]
MASTAVSAYRDRTSEFRSLSETLKKIVGAAHSNEPQNVSSPLSNPPATSYRSDFNKKASRIGLGIHETSLKIARLDKRAEQLVHDYCVLTYFQKWTGLRVNVGKSNLISDCVSKLKRFEKRLAWWKRQFIWKGGKHSLTKDTAANVDLSFMSLLTVLVLWLIFGILDISTQCVVPLKIDGVVLEDFRGKLCGKWGAQCIWHSILWNPLLKYEAIPKPKVSAFVWTVMLDFILTNDIETDVTRARRLMLHVPGSSEVKSWSMLLSVIDAQVAKRSSIFDDPIKEIQELTTLIKDDITALNVAVSDLQTLQNLEIADGNYSEDRVVHSTTVCDDLKNKLMGTTKQFQQVLTTRTENIKAHENRKQIFSTNLARENPLRHPAKTATEPPPWSASSGSSGSSQPSVSPSDGVQVGNQLRRRLAADNTPSHHMEMSMLQQVVPRQENSQSRAVALQNVESTITELSGIFTNLATMVVQQGELAIRIDDNMEESLVNVENARGALLRHLNQISSNRWLMIKIFAILIFFLMVFIFFVV